jgi:hypothetical protein
MYEKRPDIQFRANLARMHNNVKRNVSTPERRRCKPPAQTTRLGLGIKCTTDPLALQNIL